MLKIKQTIAQSIAALALALALVSAPSAKAFVAGPNPPIANAGAPQTLTASAAGTVSVTFDGTASYDPDPGDGIATYEWSNSFGFAYGVQPTVTLGVGVHTVYLTVYDSGGLPSNVPATVQITILAPATGGPVINPGAKDKTVECDGLGDNVPLMAWINSHGGASATSPNGAITWSDNYTPSLFVYNDTKCAAGHVTVVFTATDPAGKKATTSATFYVVDTTPPTLSWNIEGKNVLDDATYNLHTCDLPITITVTPSDLCGGATLSKHVATTTAGCATTSFSANTFTITRATVGSKVYVVAQATDDCGNASAQQWVIVNIQSSYSYGCDDRGDCYGRYDDDCWSDYWYPCSYYRCDDDRYYTPCHPVARCKHR